MLGVFGKYKDIDLTSKEIGEYPILEEWYVNHVGGRGVAVEYY